MHACLVSEHFFLTISLVPPCKAKANKLSPTTYFHLDDKLKHAQTHPYTTHPTRALQHKHKRILYRSTAAVELERQTLIRFSLKNKVIALLCTPNLILLTYLCRISGVKVLYLMHKDSLLLKFLEFLFQSFVFPYREK